MSLFQDIMGGVVLLALLAVMAWWGLGLHLA